MSGNGFANETNQDNGDDVRHGRQPPRPSPKSVGMWHNVEDGGDARHGAHNPAMAEPHRRGQQTRAYCVRLLMLVLMSLARP
jgi:hypothetical protein